ncbi:MAG: hypothetical protein P8N90_10235 [Glaciecola sp.]|nr:hypothetical protein [Glaciecola sp.]MDG1922473.1 hypothetical protein [Glaciecola sp.]
MLSFNDGNNQAQQGRGLALDLLYPFTIDVTRMAVIIPVNDVVVETPAEETQSEEIVTSSIQNKVIESAQMPIVSATPYAVANSDNSTVMNIEMPKNHTVVSQSTVSLSSISINQSVDFEYKGDAKLVVSAVEVTTGNTDIILQDYQPGRIYTGRLANGESLPDWVTVNPLTGLISFTGEQELNNLTIHIMAHSADGSMEILEIDLEDNQSSDEGNSVMDINSLETQIIAEKTADHANLNQLDTQLSELANNPRTMAQKLLDALHKLVS